VYTFLINGVFLHVYMYVYDSNLLLHLIGVIRQLITTLENDAVVVALFTTYTLAKRDSKFYERKFRRRSMYIPSHPFVHSSRIVSICFHVSRFALLGSSVVQSFYSVNGECFLCGSKKKTSRTKCSVICRCIK